MNNEKHKIQVGYGDGIRTIVYADVVAFLYERGQTKLAKELTIRANKAFAELDRKIHKQFTWTATASYNAAADTAAKSLVNKVEQAFKPRPRWKFWSRK